MTKQLTTLREATEEEIISHIYFVRGQKVMLDKGLAAMYAVESKVLNQSVKRNGERFPNDFMFQLSQEEWQSLRSQIVTSNKRGGVRYLPYAFTEQGVAMLSLVLRSERAIQVNIQIIRVYTKMRQLLIDNKELWQRLEAVERRMDKKDQEVQAIFTALKAFMIQEEKPRPRIGFILPAKKKKK